MAKKESAGGGQSAAGSESAGSQQPAARYEIRSPNPQFAGERLGIRFESGAGYTDDLVRAKGVCEPQVAGQTKFFTLIDRETGKQLYPVIEEADATQKDGTE